MGDDTGWTPERPSECRAWIGGKACSVARMGRAGLNVPPGFVVTTTGFEHGVSALLAGADDLRNPVRRIVDPEVELPEALRTEVAAAYQRLERLTGTEDVPVAVRSSATDEDSAERSFAGQQVSLLGVRGHDALVDALREVWASLFSREALVYRRRRRLDAGAPRMAVLVQPIVDARVAGVLFTRSPVDDSLDHTMVSTSFGLGETVVSGEHADTFVLERDTGSVIRRDVVDKPTMRVASGASVEVREVPEALRRAPSLTDAELVRLNELGHRVEAVFGGQPQDIEFAVVGPPPDDRDGTAARGESDIVLLQSRPITTGGAPDRSSTGHAAELYSNANVGEALPGVGTPMTWSIIHGFARRGFETAFGALGLDVPPEYRLVASFRGRVFLNISEFVTIASQIPLLTGENLARLAGVMDPQGLEGTYRRMSPSSFLARLPLTIPKLIVSQLGMPWRSRRWGRLFEHVRDAFFERALSAMPRRELVLQLDEIDAVFNETGEIMLAASSNFLMSYVVVSEALAMLGGKDAARKESVLFSGLRDVESAAPGLELMELARRIRRDAELRAIFLDRGDDGAPRPSAAVLEALGSSRRGRGVLAELEQFLDRWGHRAVREAEIATPRWREQPAFLIGVLRRHLAAPRIPSAEEIQAQQAAERKAATQLIRQHFLTGLGVLFRLLLRWAQHNARQREHLRAYVVDTLSMYRHYFLEIGRRWVESGAAAEADDVFFATYDEVRQWLERPASVEPRLRLEIAFRRALYEVFSESPDPPDTFVLELDRQELESSSTPPPPDATVIDGLAGSPGRVTGPARVMGDVPDPDLDIEPGEILVAPFTDVGWTPLFLVVGGVVTDRGGPLSHSCVVAREYGIPAVVGATGASRRIRTGDIITVDGDAGTVHVARAGATNSDQ